MRHGFVRRGWESWKEIAGFIGAFQTRVVLTAFYFTVAAPFGFLARLIDPLTLRRHRSDSNWTRRHSAASDLSAARRQF